MEELKRDPESEKLLAFSIREWFVYEITKPTEDFLIRIKISPDLLTVAGFIITLFAAYFFSVGFFFLGGWLVVIGGIFDYLDGRVARAINKVSRSGAFFDSVIDRYADAFLILGILFYYRNSWVMIITVFLLIGSFMVSYTKARGEALGIECKMGLIQRPIRIFYLGAGSILSSCVTISLMPFHKDPHNVPQYLLILILVGIAVLSNSTAISRSKYIISKLKEKSESSKS